MRLQTAIFTPYGSEIVLVLVDSRFTRKLAGDVMLSRLAPYFPRHPIMLVSIEENGFRAHSTFQTSRLLALLQLENITFTEIDIGLPPVRRETAAPF